MLHRQFSRFLICLLLFAVLTTSQANQALSNGFTAADRSVRTGLWWNAKRAGHGLDIQFSGETLYVIWYTYTATGAPIWYLGTGEQQDNQWTISLQEYQWDSAQQLATPISVGSMKLIFSNASNASMSWQIAQRTGEENIEPYLLSGTQATDDHTGTWFDAAEPGYGLTMSNQGSYDIAVLYFYDVQGNPIWVLGDNGGEKSSILPLFSYTSACPDCANLQTTASPAGSIHYHFPSETEASFSANIEQTGTQEFSWVKSNKTLSLLSNPASGRQHPAALARFSSDDTLEQFIKAGLKVRPPLSSVRLPNSDFSPAPDFGSRSFSKTNLQVFGVDEADFLKTDGKYLYLADQSEQQIRIVEMLEQPAAITELALIDLSDTDPLHGLYLFTEKTADDMLVSIHGGFVSLRLSRGLFWDAPWAWMNGLTTVNFYNVKRPDQPKLFTTISLGGVLIASRRIGDALYLVTRYSPVDPPYKQPAPSPFFTNQSSEDQLAQIEQLRLEAIDQSSLEELLPSYAVSNSDSGSAIVAPLVSAATTFLPPIPDRYRGTDIITVSKIDLNNPGAAPVSVSVVGQSEAVYVSQQALYISTSAHSYNNAPFSLIVEDDSQASPSRPITQRTTTQIHKISLAETAPAYIGSATIEGYLDGREDQKTFRFSEYEGVLRVVSRGDWRELGQNRITLLGEGAGSLLTEISHLPNKQQAMPLGKPDENLYATRFLGKKLYMVTFLQVDPLIVVDLSDPSNPRVQGELEIPGYSDYLHPIGDNLLLGIGKDAVAVDEGFADGRGAWLQGIRIGLFDISGETGPLQLDHVLIGQRGSETDLFNDHHAFSFLPADLESNRSARFSLPITVHGREFPNLISHSPQTYYDWSQSGLYLFEVDQQATPAQITTVGSVLTDKANITNRFGSRWLGSNRAVLTEESVFYSKDASIWSVDWDMTQQVLGPQ